MTHAPTANDATSVETNRRATVVFGFIDCLPFSDRWNCFAFHWPRTTFEMLETFMAVILRCLNCAGPSAGCSKEGTGKPSAQLKTTTPGVSKRWTTWSFITSADAPP